MKSKLLLLLLIPTRILFAQTFTEVPGTPFVGVTDGSVAFSDVNGDGYEDVLVTGDTTAENPTTKLYINDGTGTFTEKTGTPFEGIRLSSVAFSDVNGDGYNDVLITGINSPSYYISKLYTNDGTGTFTEMIGTPFAGVGASSVAFSDVNGDGYNDVMITGWNNPFGSMAKLYTNDGTGTFTEMADTPFEGVRRSSVAFSDVNGDGHNDVLITGESNTSNRIAKLYTNDGTGNFTEMENTPFEGVHYSDIAFSDVNGDGYDDVLITGLTMTYKRIAKLYTNDGMGNFTEVTTVPFIGVFDGAIAFSDVNNDGYNDVLITGQNNIEQRSTKLYTNDGTGTFTEVTDVPFDDVYHGDIAFSDVNNDGNNDVLITGSATGAYIAKLYTNNGVSFTNDFNLEIGLDFSLVPNPATASTLLLHYNSTEKSEVILKVYNANGSLIVQQQTNAVTGPQTFSVDISTLTSGHYFLELDNGTQKGVAQFVVR